MQAGLSTAKPNIVGNIHSGKFKTEKGFRNHRQWRFLLSALSRASGPPSGGIPSRMWRFGIYQLQKKDRAEGPSLQPHPPRGRSLSSTRFEIRY